MLALGLGESDYSGSVDEVHVFIALLEKLPVDILVHGYFLDELHAFLSDIQDFGLLNHFMGDVERKIFRVNESFYVPGDEL